MIESSIAPDITFREFPGCFDRCVKFLREADAKRHVYALYITPFRHIFRVIVEGKLSPSFCVRKNSSIRTVLPYFDVNMMSFLLVVLMLSSHLNMLGCFSES